MIDVLPEGYSVKQDTHGFWSPYLNGKVLRKESTGRQPPVLCNSKQEAVECVGKHAGLKGKADE